MFLHLPHHVGRSSGSLRATLDPTRTGLPAVLSTDLRTEVRPSIGLQIHRLITVIQTRHEYLNRLGPGEICEPLQQLPLGDLAPLNKIGGNNRKQFPNWFDLAPQTL